jgi:hypothetical protein
MIMAKKKESEDDLGPPKVIELKVHKSPIRMAGSCRIHESVIEGIGCERKQQIAVSAGGRTILCTLFADDLVPMGAIKLRSTDMKNLGVEDGTTVTVGARKEVARLVKETNVQTKALKKSEKDAKKSMKKSSKMGKKKKR